MNELGKILVVFGIILVVSGVILWTGVGKGWFGRMPGDINVEKGNFSFHFPIVTCLVISALATFLMWLFRK